MHELERGWAALALALVLAVSGWSASARAQESDDEAARRHFRLGQAHYENGEFAEAATEFDEAYRLSQRPQLLYNVYVAYRDSGDMPHAAHALRLYLDLVPDAENASQLRARLAAMERVLASQTTATSTDTSTDTSTTGDTTTTATDTSTDTTTTTDTTDTSTTEGGSTGSEPPPPPAASSGGGFGSSPVGWIVAGVGVAAIVGGIITGAMALDAQSTLDTQCGADRHSCPPGFESTRDTGRALGAATDGLLIGGGLLVATGVVLLFVLDGGSSEPSPVSAACDGTGCAAFVSGTF